MNARKRSPLWLLGLVFLVLAALACDDEPPPLTGITCLYERDDGTIVAPEDYATYTSADGGFTWQSGLPQPASLASICGQYRTTRSPWTLADPANPAVMYRFNPEISIERSTDGGRTWQRAVDLSGTEARTTYYVNTRHDGVEFRSGPLDAMFDQKSGNLVVAMGYEGVLIRTPAGRWGWVTVGKYSRVDMRAPTISLPLISTQLWVAALIGLVLAGTLPTLARGVNFWLLLGSAIGSAVVVVGLLYILTLIYTWNKVDISALISGLGFAIALGVPISISWKIAQITHQKNRGAFIWAGLSWTYLGILLVLFVIAMSSPPGAGLF